MLIDYEQVAVIAKNIAEKQKEIDFLKKMSDYYWEQANNSTDILNKARWVNRQTKIWRALQIEKEKVEILKKRLDKLFKV